MSENAARNSTTQPPATFLYGIDPASKKEWATFRASTGVPMSVTPPERKRYEVRELDDLVQRIVSDAADAAVVIALDAPINWPNSFFPPPLVPSKSNYPFDVPAFTMRPCEKALVSAPELSDSALRHRWLVDALGRLCGWSRPYRSKQNPVFARTKHAQHRPVLHEGISVCGYMGAPHFPVVDLFRRRLAQCLHGTGARLVTSPWGVARRRPADVFLLESHPAVTMGFWSADGLLATCQSIAEYKGGNSSSSLIDAVVCFAKTREGINDLELTNDDDLDGFVSFLNARDLVLNKGDWFGTESGGYFLVPRCKKVGISFNKLWLHAERVACRQ